MTSIFSWSIAGGRDVAGRRTEILLKLASMPLAVWQTSEYVVILIKQDSASWMRADKAGGMVYSEVEVS
jgi:hypothetical protein